VEVNIQRVLELMVEDRAEVAQDNGSVDNISVNGNHGV